MSITLIDVCKKLLMRNFRTIQLGSQNSVPQMSENQFALITSSLVCTTVQV